MAGHIVIPPLVGTLDQARNHSLATSDPVLAKLLDIPSSPLQSPWQHGADLVEQKGPGRRARKSSNHPESSPLDPLAKIMREQDKVEQAVLGHHVEFLDALDGFVILFGLLFLATQGRASDFAKVVVVEDVAEECPAPDD